MEQNQDNKKQQWPPSTICVCGHDLKDHRVGCVKCCQCGVFESLSSSRPLASGLDPENPSVDTFNPSVVSLRDYFAASALAGFGVGVHPERMAVLCWEVADAMLEARKRVQEKPE